MLYAIGDLAPRVHETAFIAPTATLIGDVVIEAGASVWFGAVLRGDSGRITIGEGTNVQDGCVLHEETTIGRNCSLAHMVLAHGIVTEDDVLIGNGALVYDGSYIERGAVIGAGAVVAPNTRVPAGALMLGVPARQARSVTTDLGDLVSSTADDYHGERVRYLAGLRALPDLERVIARPSPDSSVRLPDFELSTRVCGGVVTDNYRRRTLRVEAEVAEPILRSERSGHMAAAILFWQTYDRSKKLMWDAMSAVPDVGYEWNDAQVYFVREGQTGRAEFVAEISGNSYAILDLEDEPMAIVHVEFPGA